MSNSFYTHGAFPSTGSAATSASMRAELDLISAGFDKMPTLSGNANLFVVINSTGTGLTQTATLPSATFTDTLFTIQDDGDNTRKFQFNASTVTPGATRIYSVPDANTTLVGTDTTQTLTNKTLTAPVISSIVNTGSLSLPTSTDTLVGRATTDTLTNKTLTSPVIATIVNTGTLTLPTSTDTLVGRATTDTLTNKTLTSPVIATIVNTGTLTLPTSTDTLVGRATTDTLTNKTLTSPVIATIVNTGTLTLPTSTDTLVGRATTDTLTNKTLTSPVIATIVNTGTLTLPTSTDTLVGRATTDTLTNKTLGAFTISGTVSGGGNQINNVIIGTTTPLAGAFTTLSTTGLASLPSTGRSAAAALTVTNPAFLYGVASTYTDTASSGVIAAMAPFYSISGPTLSTSNVTTYTNAATLYIANAPTAGGSATITNPYAVYVAAGAAYFGGAVTFAGSASLAALTVTSLTNTGLTSGRVVYTTTGGLETSSANLTFNGTTLTANTIGAFTLSGTVAGGGNQINNVIIGTSTPLAGAFTTLSAATSITNTGLTATRVVYSTTGGLETDSANLTFSGTILTSTGFAGPINGTVGATTANTGSFTTLSASGLISSTAGNNANIFLSSGATTGYQFLRANNTSGDMLLGVEGATAALIAGSTAYDTVVRGATGISFSADNGTSKQMRLSASGLEITQSQLIGYSSYAGIGTNGLAVAGNVGIGTSSPGNKFAVLSADNTEATGIASFTANNGSQAVQIGYNWVGGAGASQPLRFLLNATERMRIDSSGNVGIGVSTVATNFRTQFLGTAGSNTSAASSGTTQAASAVLRLQAGGGFTATLDIGQGGGTGSWLQSCDTGNLATTYPLLLNPVGGNVGIGTSSPQTKLSVETGGTQNVLNPIIIGQTSAVNYGGMYSVRDGAGDQRGLVWQVYTANVGLNEKMRLDSSGNLLLGRTTGDGYRFSLIGTTQLLAGMQLTYSAVAASSISVTSGGAMAFGLDAASGSTERMRIDSSGNLLVGTTTNTYSDKAIISGGLTVLGTQFNVAPGADFEFVQRSAFKMVFYVNAATVLANLSITGVWTNASDARYKENITDSPYGLATVMALKPRAYNLINLTDKPQIGFIAQEVIDVVPEVVESVHNSVTNEDRYTLSYGNMVAVLTKAIQEQQALITSLTARITALELT
jgi:hypothetical protein